MRLSNMYHFILDGIPSYEKDIAITERPSIPAPTKDYHSPGDGRTAAAAFLPADHTYTLSIQKRTFLERNSFCRIDRCAYCLYANHRFSTGACF